jgi:hypothetical protein
MRDPSRVRAPAPGSLTDCNSGKQPALRRAARPSLPPPRHAYNPASHRPDLPSSTAAPPWPGRAGRHSSGSPARPGRRRAQHPDPAAAQQPAQVDQGAVLVQRPGRESQNERSRGQDRGVGRRRLGVACSAPVLSTGTPPLPPGHACGPKSPDSHRVVWGLTSRPPVPVRLALVTLRSPSGSFPFVRLPLVSRRPASSGSLPSAVTIRFGPPSVSLRVPFPFSNPYASSPALRFGGHWSRTARTEVTSSGGKDVPAFVERDSGRLPPGASRAAARAPPRKLPPRLQGAARPRPRSAPGGVISAAVMNRPRSPLPWDPRR